MIKEKIEKIMEITGVKGVAVLTKDGLIVDKIFYEIEMAELLGAMVAKINSEMEKSLGKSTDSLPIFSTIYTEKGEVLFISKEKFILFALAEKNVNIGALIIQIKNIAAQLQGNI
ncbi:MAG: roadblock/LC7 domain-containing protein [candidate division WOR-3 bacterium]